MGIRIITKRARLSLAWVAISAAPVLAELAPQSETGVTTGHVHLAAKDIAAHKAFWLDARGARVHRQHFQAGHGPDGQRSRLQPDLQYRQGRPPCHEGPLRGPHRLRSEEPGSVC